MIVSNMNGKRMLGVGMVLTILTAAVIWQATAPEGQAQSTGGFPSTILIVELSPADLTNIATGGTATPTVVSATGTVFSPDGEEVGVVRVWGVKHLEGSQTISTLNANYELPGYNGTIAAQGTLAREVVDILDRDDVVAVTGGTGTFRGANGEATLHNNGDGTFTFRLKEAKRR